MTRVFLAVWLALFAVQSAEVFSLVAPDTCTQPSDGTAGDQCKDSCLRCVCCARATLFVPQILPTVEAASAQLVEIAAPLDPATTPSPHGIFHVPKASLI